MCFFSSRSVLPAPIGVAYSWAIPAVRRCGQLAVTDNFAYLVFDFHPRPAGVAKTLATRKRNRMLIGYARVSKLDQQDNQAQVQELKRAGCKRIYQENASGGRWDRPELHKALEQLREDDVLVVWNLTDFRGLLRTCSLSWRRSPILGPDSAV